MVRPMGPLKPLPETTTLATVTVPLDELYSTKPCVWLVPTTAEPKLTTAPAFSGV